MFDSGGSSEQKGRRFKGTGNTDEKCSKLAILRGDLEGLKLKNRGKSFMIGDRGK